MTNYFVDVAKKMAFDLRRENPSMKSSKIVEEVMLHLQQIWDTELTEIKSELNRELRKTFISKPKKRYLINNNIPVPLQTGCNY